METNVENKVKIKLFVGYLISSEIKMHLSQSSLWKQAKINHMRADEDVREVHFQDRDYLGFYIPEDKLTLEVLKKYEQDLQEQVRHLCPDQQIDTLTLSIFPQVFVA